MPANAPNACESTDHVVARAASITFEVATADDAEHLVALRIAAMRESLERIGRFDPRRARDRFLSTFDPARTRHIVSDGRRVGFVVTTPMATWLSLDHLYIDPAWQSRGLGAMALAEVVAEAEALGLPVRVGALKGSDSNRFYERHGFKLVEELEFDLYYLRASAASAFSAFEADGFIVLDAVLPAARLATLDPVLLRDGASGGSRRLLAREEIVALAAELPSQPGLRALIPANHVAVQCTCFEKSTDRNWLVAIHQDLSIPVARRVASPRLRGWSQKERSLFVQPPVEVLEQLVAVRLHLDDCGETDGPLRLVPGSHRLGVVDPQRALAERDARGAITCTARAGGALVMRPLALHASSKSSGTSRRRVLHFVYGPPHLPEGLDWAVVIPSNEAGGA